MHGSSVAPKSSLIRVLIELVPLCARSPKHSKPEVSVTYNKRCDYWVVDIQCKDRQKLLFDTVCTLADMGYDVYHATIDGEHASAHQEVSAALQP